MNYPGSAYKVEQNSLDPVRVWGGVERNSNFLLLCLWKSLLLVQSEISTLLLPRNTSDALHLNPLAEFQLKENQKKKKQSCIPGSRNPINKENHFRLKNVMSLLPR